MIFWYRRITSAVVVVETSGGGSPTILGDGSSTSEAGGASSDEDIGGPRATGRLRARGRPGRRDHGPGGTLRRGVRRARPLTGGTDVRRFSDEKKNAGDGSITRRRRCTRRPRRGERKTDRKTGEKKKKTPHKTDRKRGGGGNNKKIRNDKLR